MFFNFFKKKRKKMSSASETTTIFVEKAEISTHQVNNWPIKSADEIWEKVDEAKNSGKHHIMFKKSSISDAVASQLREEGLRIKIYNSADAPQFEIFC